jgi:hypothetical protein
LLSVPDFFDASLPFESNALECYSRQQQQLPVFAAFTTALGRNHPAQLNEIAFLPISFFKTHRILTQGRLPQQVFESSGTTSQTTSRHYVANEGVYQKSLLAGFTHFWGAPAQYCFLALLPSYLERKNASLVYMVQTLMAASGHADNGFFLHDYKELYKRLQSLEARSQKVFLVGVTYALLDLAEKYSLPLQHTILVETGGMKGRRREMVRGELHGILRTAFQLESIASEYGMTELLSQAWSTGDGRYRCPPWMRVFARPVDDPLGDFVVAQTGRLVVVDLANIHSCAFIATDDLGKVYEDGSFEVLGRLDDSDLRGCNLLV